MANAEHNRGKTSKNNDYPADIYYSCYSPRILKHLIQNGFEPCNTFVNIKTLKTCHVFLKDDEINKCITEASSAQ